MDTVIQLSRTEYDPTAGLQFRLEYTKARGFFGPDAAAFEAALGEGTWVRRKPRDEFAQRSRELAAQGLPQRLIAQKLGKSAASVNRALAISRVTNGNDQGADMPDGVSPFQA